MLIILSHFRGLILCIFSGLMYGQMFTGATYVQDHPDLYPGATLNGISFKTTFRFTYFSLQNVFQI